jgi:nicotinamide-nucleotide amidase
MSQVGPPQAALVTVGNELIHGETVDTNAAWLAQALGSLGIPVVRVFTVGDVEHEIQEAVSAAMEVAELVLVSGGLGPTPDDLTKEAVSSLLGLELRLDKTLLAGLKEFFQSRGYRLSPNNFSQAEVPEGAVVLPNTRGTAPGLLLEEGSTLVFLLPGVPRELRGIFEEHLELLLNQRFDGRAEPVHHRMLHTTGIPESRLSELVSQHLPRDMGPLTLAFLPDPRGVDLRISARCANAEEAQEWLTKLENLLEPIIAKWGFEASTGDITEALNRTLSERGDTVAVAESCTGGLLSKRITDQPRSSEVFLGGIIAYQDEVKISQLGVSRLAIAENGAVSEVVACQMASGVAERLGASTGIAITGVAGPGGGTLEKPVGTVWVAVSLKETVEAQLLRLVGDRDAIRVRAAQHALALLYRRLGYAEMKA